MEVFVSKTTEFFDDIQMTTRGKYFLHSPASKLSTEPKCETTGNDKTEKTLKKSRNAPNKT